MSEIMVQMSGITMDFGAVRALENVSLSVKQGHIHALVGENGAGKTTLMRILYGAIQPTEGSVQISGEEKHFRSQDEAIHAGVGMVSQHYSIIPELTQLDNLMVGAEPGWLIPRAAAKTRADELAQRMGFDFEWDALSEGIGPAQAQKLEILKLLWRDSQIMILDEPTAMLTPADSDLLYGKLRELANAGATVIVVTHRLPEVMEYCDEVTVLRSGQLIGSRVVSETNSAELAEMIVGHAIEFQKPDKFDAGGVVLSVSELSVKGDRGDEAVKRASFELRAGEFVGLAGVDGNGQRELFLNLMGLQPTLAGGISLDDVDITRHSTAERLLCGMRLIPEDRHEEAVIEDWSIEENGILGLQRSDSVKSGMAINGSAKSAIAERITTLFPTKFDHVHQRFGALSGGNQQKVVNARAFEGNPRVILAFQPTRGIDIKVSELVFQKLRAFARSGGAVLMVNFDVDDLIEHCDRILVINHGEVFEPRPEESHDRAVIGRLMVGAQ
ncbi:MAG: ATP-binding cassette domain-containing protein [Fimbriimonadaceae bacterium]